MKLFSSFLMLETQLKVVLWPGCKFIVFHQHRTLVQFLLKKPASQSESSSPVIRIWINTPGNEIEMKTGQKDKRTGTIQTQKKQCEDWGWWVRLHSRLGFKLWAVIQVNVMGIMSELWFPITFHWQSTHWTSLTMLLHWLHYLAQLSSQATMSASIVVAE